MASDVSLTRYLYSYADFNPCLFVKYILCVCGFSDVHLMSIVHSECCALYDYQCLFATLICVCATFIRVCVPRRCATVSSFVPEVAPPAVVPI